eukprot:7541525-Pyramimonas_sp.AAC.1
MGLNSHAVHLQTSSSSSSSSDSASSLPRLPCPRPRVSLGPGQPAQRSGASGQGRWLRRRRGSTA